MYESVKEREQLVSDLNSSRKFGIYKKRYDGYKTAFIPHFFGSLFVFLGNVVYGKNPSYVKFRAIEVIARVPYHSWVSAAYTLLSWFYSNEKRAIELTYRSHFSHFAQDNETMHVVVISQLAKNEEKSGFIKHSFIPVIFAFFYFWMSYLLFLIKPKYSFELNYLFEQHAFEQYHRFITENKEKLSIKPIKSEFLDQYGRSAENQYEFFQSVRNDELIHRNRSIEEIEKLS